MRLIIAAAVGSPHGVLVGAAVLPGDLIAAPRLLRAERRPRAELAGRDRRTAEFQLRARRATDGIQIIVIVVRGPNEAGRSRRLDLQDGREAEVTRHKSRFVDVPKRYGVAAAQIDNGVGVDLIGA